MGLVCLLISQPAFGQKRSKLNKPLRPKPKPEWSIGGGAANFLGELGGRDQVGSTFVWDLEYTQTRPAVKLSYLFFFNYYGGLRTSVYWLQLAGNDNLTRDIFRANRNLHFKTDIYELSCVYEFHLVRNRMTHKYDLRDNKGRLIGLKGGSTGFYLFAGLNTFWYNPKALYNGSWIPLHPLGTEGQGLPDGPKPYSRLGLGFPTGIGFRFAHSRRMSFGLEINHRFTLTDYIDDVSTTYYDKELLLLARGEAALALSDPSLGLESSGWEPRSINAGQQRGDPTDKDNYMSVTFSLNYKLKGKTQYKQQKRRRNRSKVKQRARF